MRVRRLELIRYGRFTDACVDLPREAPDLHIVVGPNEAGKSTVMTALEDLLFGMPARSAMNFVHAYRDMRLGAILESDGDSLSLRRRKGTKNTLLSSEDVPLPAGERLLAPFLGGTTRERFERIFSLDHERLRTGGREILAAKGDIGEALFSAGSGFQDLRAVRRKLDENADLLWSKRKAGHRKYYQAKDRLEQADAARRESTVSAGKWRELEVAYKTRKQEHEDLDLEIQAKSAEQRKLERLRRVARLVRHKARLESDISSLGTVADIPESAAETLQHAERDAQSASHRMEELGAELERLRREREALNWDGALLRRAADLDRLFERRIEIQPERRDLPKRQAELAAEEGRMRALAQELGWANRDLAAKIPLRARVAEVRALIAQHAERLEQARSARVARSEAELRLAGIRERLESFGIPPDTSSLGAVLSATNRELGDLGTQIRSTERDVAGAESEARSLFGRLHPRPASSAAALEVPSPSVVRSHRDARAALDRRIASCKERLRSAERDLAEHIATRDRIEADEEPVSPARVAELRKQRDSGWSLVRRKHIDGEAVPDKDLRQFTAVRASLAAAYEQAVAAADRAVDRSVETAKAVAELKELSRLIETRLREVRALEAEQMELSGESAALADDWQAQWTGASIEPLDPESMLAWLETHARLEEAIDRQSGGERLLVTLRRRESSAVDAVLSELRALGRDASVPRSRGLRSVLDLATLERQRIEQAAATRASLETDLKDVRAVVESKGRAEARAERGMEEWRARWSQAVERIGLPTDANPDSVEAQINVIEEMRSVKSEIDNLREKRIEMMRQDIGSYEANVRGLVLALAPSLRDRDPDEAAIELQRRVEQARQARQAAKAKDTDIGRLESKIRSQAERRRRAQEDISALQALAGVESAEGLRSAIERAAQYRRFRSDLADTYGTLEQEGDGYSVEELVKECRGQDLDQATARQDTLEQDIAELRKRQREAWDRLREAETSLSEVGGSDRAAVAEGARQNALAEMEEVAAQYVRVRSAALLLQWSIDRHRREKQAPMLRTAGTLFKELTLGSFEALELDFNERDEPRLVGRRRSGERVEVEGMSAGSADQLYLSLRIAALEDYIESGQPLPFVADDLFVNFDDARSAAGLRVLGRLARRCQVLVFTHHDHLVEIARRAVPWDVRVSTLHGQEGAPTVAGERP